jgi:hypothetical protein
MRKACLEDGGAQVEGERGLGETYLILRGAGGCNMVVVVVVVVVMVVVVVVVVISLLGDGDWWWCRYIGRALHRSVCVGVFEHERQQSREYARHTPK